MEYPNPIPHPEYTQYLITRDGQCYSKISNKWLKPCLNSQGYDRFWIKNKRYFAHRLVAQTYIPNYSELPCIDHIDRNRKNNKVENLRWITESKNCLNRPVHKNNKLGIKNISKTNQNTYCFTKMVQGKIISKWFKTLEEAENYKIEWHIKNDVMLL
jgi:hypothetical protein